MKTREPLTDADGEVRELTAEDFNHFKPASALPPSLRAKLGIRGPQKTPTKEITTIRLSKSVLDAFRASGAGWQTRIDKALQEWVKTHSQV